MKTYLGFLDGQEIPDGYDHYIWASERCFEGIKWCKENNKEYEIIPKNWVTVEEIYRCIDYLEAVKEEMLEYAADLLNGYHSIHYNRDQWNVLLGYWFCGYLASYYDKFLKIRWIIEHDIECECSLYSVLKIVPALDFMEYNNLLSTTDSYHLYQYSQLLDQCGYEGRISVIERKKFEKPRLERRKVPKNLKYVIFTEIVRMFKKKDAVILQNSYLPPQLVRRAMIKNLGKVYDHFYNYENIRCKLPIDIDEEWRKKVVITSGQQKEFMGIIKSLLKMDLPISCIEDLKLLQSKSRKIYGRNSAPKAVLYAAGGISNDELFKVYLMDVRGKGTLLCDIQHGGNYGINDMSLGLRTEINICDRFYTWGWTKKHYNNKLKPMPMVKMMMCEFTSPKEDMDVLYVSYRFEKNLFKILREGILFDEYVQGEERFIHSLDRGCLRRIRFRPYISERGWGTYSLIKEGVPGLRFDHIQDFYVSLETSKLVVLGMWSTTIVEALCADRPILVRHDMQGIPSEEQKNLEEMERVGILVRTFEELAERLNQIYDNVEEWWNEPDRQEVVRRIKERYAWRCPDAEEKWLKEIESLYNDFP